MWIDHPEFMNLVANDWARPMSRTPGLIFWRKLMWLKHTLKSWNWTVFGNVFQKKKELHEKIQNLETQLQTAGLIQCIVNGIALTRSLVKWKHGKTSYSAIRTVWIR